MLKLFRREPGFYAKVLSLALPIVLQNLITNSLGLVFKLGIFWVRLAAMSENLVKCALGLYRFRSGVWINDVTVGARPEAQ